YFPTREYQHGSSITYLKWIVQVHHKSLESLCVTCESSHLLCSRLVGLWPFFCIAIEVMMEDVSYSVTSDPDVYTMEEDRAARVIQRAFRRILDMNVFKYIKNLLSFKAQGDPRLLLKCINPGEVRTRLPPRSIDFVLMF
ncbi:unnamed protein product, partial [Ranitomeya imitator]